MDHEELELAPSALQTSRLHPGLAVFPALIGLLLMVVLLIPGGPPKPWLSPVSQCDSIEAIQTLPVCDRYVDGELAGQLGAPASQAGRVRERFVDHQDMVDAARADVIENAGDAKVAYRNAMEWYAAQSEAVRVRRWQALWPAGGGVLLSLLLGGFLLWRRPRSHRVRLTAHHLELNGRRLALADLEEIVLDDVVGHNRTLRVLTADGDRLSVSLPAFEPATDRLEQLLAERLPALEERRQEREDGTRIRAEAQVIRER